jgi:hypothetical protein
MGDISAVRAALPMLGFAGTAVGLAWIGVVLGATGRAAESVPLVPGPGTACLYGEWSEPKSIASLPRADRLSAASVRRLGAANVIFGNLLPTSTENWIGDLEMPPNPLLIHSLDGRDLPKPEGEFWFVHPRTLQDDRGRVHMFWGEPGGRTSLTVPEFTRGAVQSVWYAVLDPTEGWSEPIRAQPVEVDPPSSDPAPPRTIQVSALQEDPPGDIWWGRAASPLLSANGEIQAFFPLAPRTR